MRLWVEIWESIFTFRQISVSLLVRLWVEMYCWGTVAVVRTVSLLVRLWVEMSNTGRYDIINLVSLLVRLWVEMEILLQPTTAGSVSLLVRLWVEILLFFPRSFLAESASLWGCELKCRVPRIWLFHCNRQIILRSGIKSLQPFERWSNLLQVTCDLW